MGDKAAARRAADASGMPVVPGTPEPVDAKQARKQAERIGFPLLVKAAFGGGGKGMHIVRDAGHLEEALKRGAREAQSYFGRPEVFLERYVDRARHVEAQIIADTHGTVLFLGERDCTVQRRHQKLIEETPSTAIDDTMRERLAAASIALARETGYVNAGTIECIVDEDGDFFFLEMNTRIQVEHAVTEMVTGLDLVALQIGIAMGESLDEPRRSAPGSRDRVPHQRRGPGAQLHARARAHHAVRGAGRPVRARRRRVRAGARDPRRLRLDVREARRLGHRPGAGATTHAAGARRVHGRRRAHHDRGAPVDPRLEGVPDRHAHHHLGRARAGRGGLPAHPELGQQGPHGREGRPADILVEVDGRRVPVRVFDERRDVAPRPPEIHSAAHQEHVHGEVRAEMQGTIVKVLVEKGQDIRAGEVICILEAMKMENHIAATRDGEVTDLPIRAGQVVQTGQTLAVID